MDDFGPAEDVIGDVMGSLRAIEQEHIDKGPKRTVHDVRLAAIECLKELSLACEGRFKASNLPYPLQILLEQLLDVDAGHQSDLFSHLPVDDPQVHYGLLRAGQQAEAVALLEYLHPTAAKRIAGILMEGGFKSPRGGEYSVDAILEWRDKNAAKPDPVFQFFYTRYREIGRAFFIGLRAQEANLQGKVPEEIHRESMLWLFKEELSNTAYQPGPA